MNEYLIDYDNITVDVVERVSNMYIDKPLCKDMITTWKESSTEWRVYDHKGHGYMPKSRWFWVRRYTKALDELC